MNFNLTKTLEGLSSTISTPTSDFVDAMSTTSSSIMATITTEIPPEDCPIYNKSDDAIIEMFSFW